MDDQAETPTDLLARMEAGSQRIETPCGKGHMVWHCWGEGARTPLVLLHGGYGSWRHWARNISVFAVDRRVIAADLPGLGESASPEGDATPPAIAAIVRDGLRLVLPDAQPYDLAGFSFGGMIAGNVGAIDGGRIRTLTIVGPGGLGFRSPVQLEKLIGLRGEARVAGHRVNLSRLMFADPSRIDALALAIQEWNTRHARTRSRPMSRTASLQSALAQTRMPLNAIYGEFDAVSYPHLSEREDAIRAVRPDVDFRIIKGAGHWVAYEAADAFNAMLRQMLDRVP